MFEFELFRVALCDYTGRMSQNFPDLNSDKTKVLLWASKLHFYSVIFVFVQQAGL